MIRMFYLKIKVIKENIWEYFYFISLISLFLAFVANKEISDLFSQYLIVISFGCSFLGFITLTLNTSKKKNMHLIQLVPIYVFFSIFWVLSFLSEQTEKRSPLVIMVGMVCLILPILWIAFFWKARLGYIKKFIDGIIGKWPLAFILFSFILLSIETLDDWPRLDTDIYCHYLDIAQKWDFTFSSFDMLSLGGHQCFGYTIWGLIGMYLTPGDVIGVRIINIVLYGITIICFYFIVKKYGYVDNRFSEYLITATFAFNPLILGLIYEVNLDTPSTCFYVWTLCALLYRKNILLAFCSFLLAFSKETGIILLFGIAMGWFCPLFIKLIKGNRKEVFIGENLKYFLSFGFPALLFLIFLRYGMLWRQEKNSLSIDGLMMDKIGIHFSNIYIKLIEVFIINFSWIITLVIIISLLHIAFKRIKKNKIVFRIPDKKYLPIIFSTLFFLIFQFIYITYCHIRYITPLLVGLIILFSYSLSKLLKGKIYNIFLVFFITLIIIENFLTVDLVSDLFCAKINIGKGTIITTRTFVRSGNNLARTKETDPEYILEFGLTNSAIYNRQFSYFEDAFLKCLQTIEYDNDTYILITPIYEEPAKGMTWISLFGKWYDENIYYDNDKKRIVSNINADKMNLSVYTPENEIDLSKYSKVYLLGFPYNESFNMDKFLEKFDIIDSFSVCKKLWQIDVYRIK